MFPDVGDRQVLGKIRVQTKACLEFPTAMTDMNPTQATPVSNHSGQLTATGHAAKTVAARFSFRAAGGPDSVSPGFYLIRLRQQQRMVKPVIAPRFVTQP